MTKIRTLQIYRGTTAQNNAYTGSAGELTMDTTTNELRLHDGSTAGGHIIGSGGSGGYHPDLFDHKWADHILNDVQWLRADTFSWQSGAVYQVAYQHLADDIDGKTLQSETVAETTIQFYLADDGHKICPASEESNVSAIYNATGVAWYYIIDTANTRFKLPRTKFGFTGIRSGVGNYIEPTLPNIKTVFDALAYTSAYNASNVPMTSDNGILYNAGDSSGYMHIRRNEGQNFVGKKLGLDVSKGSDIYKDDATVQTPATEQYLYFYVGNFTQTALENTAGINAELFNEKANLDLSNAVLTSTFAQLLLNAGIDTVVERQEATADNGYTWYKKYKSGLVEQGGRLTQSGTATLPVEMSDTNYNLQLRLDYNSTGTIQGRYWYATKTTTGFTMAAFLPLDWLVCGKAA